MNNKILIITQCFPCGSWLSIEKIANKLSNQKYNITILGYGKPLYKNSNQSYYLIPYLPYNRFGHLTTYSPIIGLFWNLPLYILALVLVIFIRPKTIIYNGLGLGLVMSPLFKILHRKNIIMYHSTIKSAGKRVKTIVKTLFSFVDLVVVNSEGSKNDLGNTIDKKKVIVNEHFADNVFFNSPRKLLKPHTNLKILYAGRIDVDKRCFPLIEFAKKMKNNPNFEFTFAGRGSDVALVSSLPNKYKYINYKGYIDEKEMMAKLYREADVLWSFADSTYLGLPAIEALACNTPIIIPKYAAIINKNELINPSLVPTSIGWLIDPFNQKNIERTISKIQKNKEYRGKKCRQYALRHYSSKNVAKTVNKIKKIIKL